MIHTMPDKTVRVTSRYPKGHGTVFFDLVETRGFRLEKDAYDPDTLVLRAVGCYGDHAAHYGDSIEAEADFADLTTMLGDRHAIPAASPVPALTSTQPPLALGRAKRRGWGWKGTMAGLALGALSTVVATRTLGTNTAADDLALRAAAVARALPHDDSLSQGQGATWRDAPPSPRPSLPGSAAVPQAARSAAPPMPQLQPHGPPRPSPSNFGLQP